MTDIARSEGHVQRVALFIDVDNVLILAQGSGLPFNLSLIIDRVRQQGMIMSSRAYADWTANLLKPVLHDFRTNAIELVQLPTSTASKEHKNTADIQLAVDALEMVFSSVRPDTIVIVGGDRDYVPLVQKLKRYGIFVMGIGVEAGVSRVLTEACDSFVFYDDLVPPPPEETQEPLTSPDPTEAYSLMRRAIEALNRESRATTGAAVHAMMKQLAPAFDLARYKTTLKVLAEDAAKADYVSIVENPGSDFTLAASQSSSVVSTSISELARRDYDYSTHAATTATYRTILQDRRIPLLPWSIREKFIELIWNDLSASGGHGMSLDAMRANLLYHAEVNELNVSPQMIQKLLYSLNFARCFSHSSGAATGSIIPIPDDLKVPVHPVIDSGQAIDRVHEKYIEVIARDAAILDPNVVFDLLYGADLPDDEVWNARREALVSMCDRIKPLGGIGQALVEAGHQVGRSSQGDA